jgi:hypothetical protein
MGELADRLDRVHVRVAIPGGEISAEMRGESDVRLAFEPGYYDYFRDNERELERKLAILCRLLFAARTREFEAVIQAAGGESTTRERAVAPLDVEYFERLDRLAARGCSPDGRIEITTVGFREWAVKIQDGTVRSLYEEEFSGRATDAAYDLIRNITDEVLSLRQHVYHPALNGGRQ